MKQYELHHFSFQKKIEANYSYLKQYITISFSLSENKMSLMEESVRTFTDIIVIEVIKTLNSNLVGPMMYEDRVNTLIGMAITIPLIKYRINAGAKKIYLHRAIIRVLSE